MSVNYPKKDDDFDPAAESYREEDEAIFIGTEGERPARAHGEVLEDQTKSKIKYEKRPD
jgi:hypothetical protein